MANANSFLDALFSDEVIPNKDSQEAASGSLFADKKSAEDSSAIKEKTHVDYHGYIREYKRLSDQMNHYLGYKAEDDGLNEFLEALDDGLDNLQLADIYSFNGIFKAVMEKLTAAAENYKDLHEYLNLNQLQLMRVKVMNRLECLYLEFNDEMLDPCMSKEAVNFKVVEKTIQAILMYGCRHGNTKDIYKKALFDYKLLYKASSELLEAKPYVQEFGKSVAMKDRAVIVKMSGQNILELIVKSLKKKPEEILAYSDSYKEYFGF